MSGPVFHPATDFHSPLMRQPSKRAQCCTIPKEAYAARAQLLKGVVLKSHWHKWVKKVSRSWGMRSLYLEKAALPSRSQQLPNVEVPPRSHSSSRYFHLLLQTFYKSLPLHEQAQNQTAWEMRNCFLMKQKSRLTRRFIMRKKCIIFSWGGTLPLDSYASITSGTEGAGRCKATCSVWQSEAPSPANFLGVENAPKDYAQDPALFQQSGESPGLADALVQSRARSHHVCFACGLLSCWALRHRLHGQCLTHLGLLVLL